MVYDVAFITVCHEAERDRQRAMKENMDIQRWEVKGGYVNIVAVTRSGTVDVPLRYWITTTSP